MRGLVTAVAIAIATITLAAKQTAVYRARTDAVAISVSVKRGNAPVGNLTSSDFALFDEDVPQDIEALTIESVPLDVTLFLDTSGSTGGSLDDMKRDVSAIAVCHTLSDDHVAVTPVAVPNWLLRVSGEVLLAPIAVFQFFLPTTPATSCTVVVWLSAPLVPVIVSVDVPSGVSTSVVTVSVAVPAPVSEVGLNEAEAFAGTPLTDRLTAPAKPFTAPIVTV